MTHLWELDHAYYCSDNNFYSNECHIEYESWKEFFDEEGDSDRDYNLIFRFDWEKADPDNKLPHDTLKLFFMGQRKGLFLAVEIAVKDEDESAVREWLYERWKHLWSLWEPISWLGTPDHSPTVVSVP